MKCLTVGSILFLAPLAHSQAADGFYTRQGPDPERAKLTVPEPLWNQIKAATNHQNRNLGYTFEEMLGFPTFEHRLRTVENLFRDVRHPAEFGGLMGDNLLAYKNEPAQLAYMLWSQLEARAGREWKVPATKDDWGVTWISSGAKPLPALLAAMRGPNGGQKRGSELNSEQLDAIAKLGPERVRLLARLVIAGQLAKPFLVSAVPATIYQSALPPFMSRTPRREEIYGMLVSPYLGDVNDDTIIVENRAAYDAMRLWDANRSAFGSALFLRHFDAAMKEFRGEKLPSMPNMETVEFETPLGMIYVSGSGADKHATRSFLTVDFGGNDSYSGLIGAPANPTEPISIVLDLGEGKDTYDGSSTDGNLGCGLFGLGMVFDEAGDDTYTVKNGGIGFGLYGTGMVIDERGNDTYRAAKGWSQGAAYAGVGLLADLAGNDKYFSICMSMGFGGTRGIGTLLDVTGNDSYFTADSGNDSKVWGRTVSMSLGCGYGRRCDSGDGQNQGGGFGIVVEGAGDDTYHTGIFTLGSGYWWGAGIFEDRAGNDKYRCAAYSIGSGAHFAVGSFVDLSGNDEYNNRKDAEARWAAIGRDGSIAVCLDGGGDDIWANITGGHCDLNSYALFWDRAGNDKYPRIQPFDPNSMGNRPFGSAAPYGVLQNFRDRLPSVGVFLDTAGKDEYPQGMNAAESSTWMIQNGPLYWGYGWDGEWK